MNTSLVHNVRRVRWNGCPDSNRIEAAWKHQKRHVSYLQGFQFRPHYNRCVSWNIEKGGAIHWLEKSTDIYWILDYNHSMHVVCVFLNPCVTENSYENIHAIICNEETFLHFFCKFWSGCFRISRKCFLGTTCVFMSSAD